MHRSTCTSSTLANAAAVIAITLAMPALTPAQAQTTPAPAATTSVAEAAFKRADSNGDGKLSKEEATRLPAIDAKFDDLDRDKDGFLSLAEFVSGYDTPK